MSKSESDVSVEAVEAWLAEHTGPPMSLQDLAVSMEASAPEVAAVPASAIVGGNAVDYATADQQVTDAAGDAGKLTEVLLKNPIVGCTTVMDIALTRSSFNPLMPATEGNYTAYLAYLDILRKAPFFHINYADEKTIDEQSSNWDTLLNSIADMFDAVTSQDKTRIVTGLKQLAHAATSTNDKTQELNVFSQTAIAQNTSEINVAVYHSSVSMVEHDGKHTTMQSSFVVQRSSLNFLTDQWPTFAPSVAKQQISRVDKWLAGNNSPTSN